MQSAPEDMRTEAAIQAASQAEEKPTPPREVVWDWGVRLGHWAILACVIYLFTHHDTKDFPGHDVAGYAVVGIVTWRFVWGFVGTRYARFSAFLYSPRETLSYTLSALKMGDAREYTSHNPMGALMVFVLLAMLTAITTLGLMLLAAQQLAGPLAGWVPTDWDAALETAHGTLAYGLLGAVSVHILGTVWASWWHRENYVWSMITGRKVVYKRRRKRTTAADRRD